jgi:hypothetical protein
MKKRFIFLYNVKFIFLSIIFTNKHFYYLQKGDPDNETVTGKYHSHKPLLKDSILNSKKPTVVLLDPEYFDQEGNFLGRKELTISNKSTIKTPVKGILIDRKLFDVNFQEQFGIQPESLLLDAYILIDNEDNEGNSNLLLDTDAYPKEIESLLLDTNIGDYEEFAHGILLDINIPDNSVGL